MPTTQRIEIAKPVKLTPTQHIALISAANHDGILKSLDFSTAETLRYLGLIKQVPIITPEGLKQRTQKAWAALAAAARQKDAKAAEDAVALIRSESWDRNKTQWVLTPAADEYLLKGRVIVTVGRPVKTPQRLTA